ncbi:hypothetical protein [Actinomadura harenae]|uniref:hypothetical protein n=1 Tax=Actinomadura harenae TaxID=2483351 RepID=UPI0011C410EA|nr:hypothetical protein [Actinomadura harenae]
MPALKWGAQRKASAEWDAGAGGVRTLNADSAEHLRWMLGQVAVWDTEVATACGSVPYEVRGPLARRDRLVALDANLRGLGLTTGLSNTSVLVLAPDRAGAEVRIVCRERPSDGDALWFWDDASGAPLAEAHRVTDAVVAIRGLLAAPARVAS